MNRSMRYSKLMKTMGLPAQEEQAPEPALERESMTPEKTEALTGTEHPELAKNRQLQMLIDAKISQLEGSEDPNALETLNFWKQRREQLAAD